MLVGPTVTAVTGSAGRLGVLHQRRDLHALRSTARFGWQLSRKLQELAGLSLAKDIRSGYAEVVAKPSQNAVIRLRHNFQGGQHGYFSTTLAARSADYFEIQRRYCCRPVRLTVHFES